MNDILRDLARNDAARFELWQNAEVSGETSQDELARLAREADELLEKAGHNPVKSPAEALALAEAMVARLASLDAMPALQALRHALRYLRTYLCA